MVMLNENNIEIFIRENRDKFGISLPPDHHKDKFLYKLQCRLKHIINIIPYLIRVAVVTLFVFTASIIVWNNYVRRDRHEVSLKSKISLVLHPVFNNKK
jgi:hypothetical protein